ncbi:MAG: hypothetical protein ACYDBP_04460, partial [Leptospirales bacterium]
ESSGGGNHGPESGGNHGSELVAIMRRNKWQSWTGICSYETLLLMRTFTRSPIDRLLLRLEEAGVDVSGARYELSLGRELLSIYSTILDNVQGQSSLPREAAKAGLSLPKKGGSSE